MDEFRERWNQELGKKKHIRTYREVLKEIEQVGGEHRNLLKLVPLLNGSKSLRWNVPSEKEIPCPPIFYGGDKKKTMTLLSLLNHHSKRCTLKELRPFAILSQTCKWMNQVYKDWLRLRPMTLSFTLTAHHEDFNVMSKISPSQRKLLDWWKASGFPIEYRAKLVFLCYVVWKGTGTYSLEEEPIEKDERRFPICSFDSENNTVTIL